MTGALIGAPVLFITWIINCVYIKYDCLNRIIVCTLLFACTSVLSANDRVTLSTGVDYSKGAYGATSDTKIWYIPFSVKLEKPKIVYKLTVPFIQITGPGYVTGADAVPSGTGGTGQTTESGMGDIIASASYALVPYLPERPAIDITAKIKFPTADESRGLGTGETDYYLQADGLYGSGKLTTFSTLGYKIYGDPPGVNYKNVFYFSLGGSFSFTNKFSGGFIYDFRQAATASGADVKEVLGFASKKLDKNKKMLVYLVKGLSDGSPDWAIGINFGYVL